jgi:hypothetical protein
MNTDNALIQAATRAWTSGIARATEQFTRLQPQDFQREVAPGRNTVFYLFGHLIAIHDRMYELLGFGPRSFAYLDDSFISLPDQGKNSYPELSELQAAWSSLHPRLEEHLRALRPEAWSGPHSAVSQAEFEESPWRNRFSILLSRTTHLAYHMGQIRLARPESQEGADG